MSQYSLPQLQLEYIGQHALELLQTYPDQNTLDIGVTFSQQFKNQFGLPMESDFPTLNVFIDALNKARADINDSHRHFNPGPYHTLSFAHNHIPVNNLGLVQFTEYQDNSGLLSGTDNTVSGTQTILNGGPPLNHSYPVSVNGTTPQMATPQPTRIDAPPLHEPSPQGNAPSMSSVIAGPISSTAQQTRDYFGSTEFDPQNAMELFFEGGEATVEQGQIEDAPAKKKKSIERKNQFYPNKSTAMNLWAKSDSASKDISTITEEVDEIIKADPDKSSDYRMTLINERRSKCFNNLPLNERRAWEQKAKESDSKPPEFGSVDDKLALMRNKIYLLRKDGYEAFGVPFVGIVFAADDDTGEANATVYDCDGVSNGRHGFTTWLLQECGRRAQSIFLAQLNKYARYVHERAAAPSGNRSGSVAPEAKKAPVKAPTNPKAQIGQEWVNGLRKVPPIDGLNAQDLRVLYANAVHDRWKLAGYTDNHVPWQRIADNNEHFIRTNANLSNVKIVKPEAMGKANTQAVLNLFILQQGDSLDDEGNPSERGLLFLPCGSGASFIPKAKRPVYKPGAEGIPATSGALVNSSVSLQTANASTPSTAPIASTSYSLTETSRNLQRHLNVVNSERPNSLAPADSTPATDPKSASPMETDAAISTSSLNSGVNTAPAHSPSAPPIPADATASPLTPPTKADKMALPPISANANAMGSPPAPTQTNATALAPISPLPADTTASSPTHPTQVNTMAPPPTPANANATVLPPTPLTASNAMAPPPAPPTAPDATALPPTNVTLSPPIPPIPADAVSPDTTVDAALIVDATLANADAPVAPVADIEAENAPNAKSAGAKRRYRRVGTPKGVAGPAEAQRGSKRKAEAPPDNQPIRKSTRFNTQAAPTD